MINPEELPRTAIDALGIGDRVMIGSRPDMGELEFAIAAQALADSAGLHYQEDVVAEVMAGNHLEVSPEKPAIDGLTMISEPTRLPNRF